ncbi:hypothetical protein HAX54_034623, partial [Datura stramonium]|nr:hypothetical protein [Datura stramonium]
KASCAPIKLAVQPKRVINEDNKKKTHSSENLSEWDEMDSTELSGSPLRLFSDDFLHHNQLCRSIQGKPPDTQILPPPS